MCPSSTATLALRLDALSPRYPILSCASYTHTDGFGVRTCQIIVVAIMDTCMVGTLRVVYLSSAGGMAHKHGANWLLVSYFCSTVLRIPQSLMHAFWSIRFGIDV